MYSPTRVSSLPTMLATYGGIPFQRYIFWTKCPLGRSFLNSSQKLKDGERLDGATQSLVNFKGLLVGILSYIVLAMSEISVNLREYFPLQSLFRESKIPFSQRAGNRKIIHVGRILRQYKCFSNTKVTSCTTQNQYLAEISSFGENKDLTP